MLTKLFNNITNRYEKDWYAHVDDYPAYMKKRTNRCSEPHANTFYLLIDAAINTIKLLFSQQSTCQKNITNINRDEFHKLVKQYFWSYLLFFLKENEKYAYVFIDAAEIFMKVRRQNYDFVEYYTLENYEKDIISYIKEKKENYKEQTRDYLWLNYIAEIFHNDEYTKELFYKSFIVNYDYYFHKNKELLKFIDDDVNACESLEFLKEKNEVLYLALLNIMRPNSYLKKDDNELSKILKGVKLLEKKVMHHDSFDLYSEEFINQKDLKILRKAVEEFKQTHILTYQPRSLFEKIT